jgi:hypothetical protein
MTRETGFRLFLATLIIFSAVVGSSANPKAAAARDAVAISPTR